jgi:hypothetical protein
MKAYIIFYCSILSILFSNLAQAQTNSLYARFGLGIQQPPQSVRSLGMGGVSIADNGAFVLNYMNPASYGFLRQTTFQVAAYGERNNVRSTTTETVPTGTVNISYINIGMPIGKRAGLAFGLLPYMRSYYNASSSKIFMDSTKITSIYKGSGGIQKAYIGAAAGVGGLRVGVNLNVLFGNFSKESANGFYDTFSVINTVRKVTDNSVSGIQPTFGAQYNVKVRSKDSIKFGITYGLATTLKNSSESYSLSSKEDSFFPLIDTLSADTVVSKIKIPAHLNIGVMYRLGERWQIGAEINKQNWTQYSYAGSKDSMNDETTLRLGIRYEPKTTLTKVPYTQRLSYSAGVYTGENNLRINNTVVSSTGVTVGLGLPIKKVGDQVGTVQLSLQTGVRGTIENSLMREGFTRFTIGASLSEIWFQKGKYN